MLTVKVSELHGNMKLLFVYPDGTQESASATNYADVKRMMYFRTRKYIHAKLTSWLVQRNYAISPFPTLDGYAQKLATIKLLLFKINEYEHLSIWRYCAFIARNESNFKLIAPSTKSKYHANYLNKIQPILEFCKAEGLSHA